MVHIETAAVLGPIGGPIEVLKTFSGRLGPVNHSVLVVRDNDNNNDLLDTICEFLDIGVEYATSEEDLAPLLRAIHPIAVIADLEAEDQDGFHVMKTTAGHNPDLPVLLLTNGDPSLLGAVDAVREIWGLTKVSTATGGADIGLLVDFLCRAARDAGMSRLIRV